MISLKPNYFPKAPSLNNITLEIRTSIYELVSGGGVTIQSLALHNLQKKGIY